jgi:hypothetical protein
VAAEFMRTPRPLTLWMVPSDTIKTQTLEALRTVRHPYRQRLDAVFGGRVRIFDIAEFETLRPQDDALARLPVATSGEARGACGPGGRVGGGRVRGAGRGGSRIRGGPVSCAPTMTGAFDQTSAAASRLSPDLGKFWLRIELASRGPSPAPVICNRHAVFSPVPALRIAAVTARSPAATSAAIIATMSGSMSSFSFTRASD